MARKAPQCGQNLALSTERQWFEPYEASAASPGSDSEPGADPHPVIALLDHINTTMEKSFRDMITPAPAPARRASKTKIDVLTLFTRFATLSTLSTYRSNPTLDEPEAPTLDATGLRHALQELGHGVPNRMSVRPMLVEFGEVVGCQPRLTYAQFETLRAALDELAAAATLQRAWRVWRARGAWDRAFIQANIRFARMATVARDGPWWSGGTAALASSLGSPITGCVACEGACEGDEKTYETDIVAAPVEYDLGDAVFGAKSDGGESPPLERVCKHTRNSLETLLVGDVAAVNVRCLGIVSELPRCECAQRLAFTWLRTLAIRLYRKHL